MAGACMAINAIAVGAALAADTSAQWPESWRKDYRRFETYIQARATYWQPSMLAIRPSGEVDQGVMIYEERTQHLTLDVYQAGEVMLGLAVKPSTNLLKGRNIPVGTYAAVLRSASGIGYQHHSPMVWFSVSDVPDAESGRMKREVAMIPPPGEGEAIWPNERMLLFVGFNILPRHFSNELQLENNKVSPAIVLRLDDQGSIHRSALANPVLEKFLCWRVYHDGRLIDQSAAGNVLTYTPPAGVGGYVVMLVVEGPRGPMPVSNIMQYPLFPGAGGHYAIVPPDGDGDGLPDFLDADPISPTMKSPPAWRRAFEDDLINPAADKALVALWRRWAYDINGDPDRFRKERGIVGGKLGVR